MDYPTFVINFDHLLANREDIDNMSNEYYNTDDESRKGYEILNEDIKYIEKVGYGTADFGDLRLTMIDVDLRSEKQRVEDTLDELGVEYKMVYK